MQLVVAMQLVICQVAICWQSFAKLPFAGNLPSNAYQLAICNLQLAFCTLPTGWQFVNGNLAGNGLLLANWLAMASILPFACQVSLL